MKITWKEVKQRYGSAAQYCLVGGIHVATCGWNGLKSKNDPEEKTYSYNILLPGFKEDAQTGYASTMEQVKINTEKLVQGWFAKALKDE